MRPRDIALLLRTQPFVPIRVFVSDGSTYDVGHPEMMMVGRTQVVIGLPSRADDVFERFAYCDPVHITRFEPINGRRPRAKAKRRR